MNDCINDSRGNGNCDTRMIVRHVRLRSYDNLILCAGNSQDQSVSQTIEVENCGNSNIISSIDIFLVYFRLEF